MREKSFTGQSAAVIATALIVGAVLLWLIFSKVLDSVSKARQDKRDLEEKKRIAEEARLAAAKWEAEQIAAGRDPAQVRAEAERKRKEAMTLNEQIEDFDSRVKLSDCQKCATDQPYWGQDIAKPDSFWLAHTATCLPIKRACNAKGMGFNTRPPGRISPPNDYTG